MSRLVVDRVHAESRAFARHHAIRLPAAGAELAIGPERDRGGFGAVHPVVTVDGRQPTPALLAKVMGDEPIADARGPEALARRIAGLQRALEARPGLDWADALLALPFSVLGGALDGRQALVLLMLDLKPLGYVPAPFAGDKPVRESYGRGNPDDRLDLATSFAERAELLEEVAFVHGDVNPPNVLIHLPRRDVQIIDFDAGVVVATGRERPLTAGKADPCMPPEVKVPGKRDPDRERYTPGAERWAVASLLGIVLTGVHPGFFLAAIGARTVDAYARSGRRWPDVDQSGDEFRQVAGMPALYAQWLKVFEALPGRVRELFAVLFEAGTDGDRRPRAADWAAAMRSARLPPELVRVEVSDDLVVEGTEVVLSWASTDADYVESPVLGRLAPTGSIPVIVERSVSWGLVAVNRYGPSDVRSSPVVRVVPLPRIETLPIPCPPNLHLTASFALQAPPRALPPQVEVPRFPHAPSLAPVRRRSPDGRPSAPVIPPLPALSAMAARVFPRLDLRHGRPFRR